MEFGGGFFLAFYFFGGGGGGMVVILVCSSYFLKENEVHALKSVFLEYCKLASLNSSETRNVYALFSWTSVF